MAAKQELRILESGDMTETNRIELTLAAAYGRAICALEEAGVERAGAPQARGGGEDWWFRGS